VRQNPNASFPEACGLKLARILLLSLIVSCATAREESGAGNAPASPALASRPDLTRERERLDRARAALAASDHATARAGATEAVAALLDRREAEEDEDYQVLLHDAGAFAWEAHDARAAKEAWGRLLELRSRRFEDDDPALQEVRHDLALPVRLLGDLSGARSLQEKVLEVRTRTLPADSLELQRTRVELAWTVNSLGDRRGARALLEQAVEVLSRTQPDDHPDLLSARLNLAWTMLYLGEFQPARELEERVLEIRSRTLPADHVDLQKTRQGLAAALFSLGDLQGARVLQDQVLEVFLRTHPDDHPDLQWARGNLARTLFSLGDARGARPLEEKVLQVRSETLPADHPHLQAARMNLAITLNAFGEVEKARELEEQALESWTRTLPDDHPHLQYLRGNLAATQAKLGDLRSSRALLERVLEVQSRTLPEDHGDLQATRVNLALTIKSLGDLQGARMLQEQALEIWSRNLPGDHPDLQSARLSLAQTLKDLGEVRSALDLQEQVLEVWTRTRADDDPELQNARLSLGWTNYLLGDVPKARSLCEAAVDGYSRRLPDDHLALQMARGNLAIVLQALGDLEGARELQRKALDVWTRTLPEEHPELQKARLLLAWTTGRLLARGRDGSAVPAELEKECAQLVLSSCRAQTRAARAVLLESSAREAQARCEALDRTLDTALSLGAADEVLGSMPEIARATFEFGETTRGAALGAASIMRQASSAPEYRELRAALRALSDETAELARKGTTSAEFQAVLERRDRLQRDLVELAGRTGGGTPVGLAFDLEPLARRLRKDEAVAGYRRYLRATTANEPSANELPVERRSVESLCAFVVRRRADALSGDEPDVEITRIELGPLAPIQEAVKDWRDSLGAGSEAFRGLGAGANGIPRRDPDASGRALRKLVFDPLLPALGNARRIVLALDDVLHLVPIEALPAEEAGAGGRDRDGLVGERWHIETRCTLAEMLSAPLPRSGDDVLVSVGGADFDSQPLAPDVEELPAVGSGGEAIAETAAESPPARLRGSAWVASFSPLAHTSLEVRGVEALHEKVRDGSGTSIGLLDRRASRAAFEELAPRARWLHIATHGWFAPESMKSWSDARPLDEQSRLGMRLSGVEQMQGLSPMLLCGLAFAGANLPEDEVGRSSGLVTAEELSTLDLSTCELAVLSACDTNVGERRAGQGVASLQRALHMAGARSVVTSLWKVPDEATRELMLDFYERLWVEKKPKWQALWEAKMRLRDARDAAGIPAYTTRDWAAWVLTGDPQ